jgi:5-methylcytosine-specific restriction endonuclease McrA
VSYIPASLREFVIERAKGCCEYCGYPSLASFAPHEIDHIIAQKHGGATSEDNLALSCTLCNQHKGSDLSSIDPLTQKLEPLFHPRQDTWLEHFRLEGATIQPLTPKGRVTVRLLQLNQVSRVSERQLLIEAGYYPFIDER